jgi:hypothetical protein
MGRSFLTLFECITGGVDWDDAVAPLMDSVGHWIVPLFCLYISFSVLALLNVITGFFVQSSLDNAKKDNDTFMIGNVREAFKKAVANDNPNNQRQREINSSASMTWEDFEAQLRQPNMQAYFKAIDVDPSEARGLFRLIDLDNSGAVDFEEFLSGCLRLRGPAKALDLHLLMHEVKRSQKLIRAGLVKPNAVQVPRAHKTGLYNTSVRSINTMPSIRVSQPAPPAEPLGNGVPRPGSATKLPPLESQCSNGNMLPSSDNLQSKDFEVRDSKRRISNFEEVDPTATAPSPLRFAAVEDDDDL